MGLALLDVADAIRPHPEVVAFLQHVEDEGFLDELAEARGRAAKRATPSRRTSTSTACAASGRSTSRGRAWRERPTTLVPVILGNIKNFEPGAGRRRFEQGRQEAQQEGAGACSSALRALPDGSAEGRRDQADDRPGPDLHRLPRVSEVRHRQPLLRLQAGVDAKRPSASCRPACFERGGHLLPHASRSSRRSCARTGWTTQLIRAAQGRVQGVSGAHAAPGAHLGGRDASPAAYRRDDVPAGALVGLAGLRRDRRGPGPRHPGHGGGRSRAGRHPGHGLHGPQLDALFVAITGLVTEVGGLMTHGAVIAREYGLPAVVGGGARHPADPGRPADPRARNRRLRRDPAVAERDPHVAAAAIRN